MTGFDFGGGSKIARFNNFAKKLDPPFFLQKVSSQTNIRNAIFDQRSARPPEVGVSRWHRQTYRQTHGHGDLLTNSAQWGRVGENYKMKKFFRIETRQCGPVGNRRKLKKINPLTKFSHFPTIPCKHCNEKLRKYAILMSFKIDSLLFIHNKVYLMVED